MNTLIVTDAKALNKLINDIATTGQKYRAMLHRGALSVMYHAMHHGDARPMDRLFSKLQPNDQRAFRLYWRRLSYEITATADVSLVKYSQSDGFSVIRNDDNPKASEYRAAAAAFITDRLASAKPGKWRKDAAGEVSDIQPFYAVENFRESLTDFGDKNILATLKALQKRINEGKAPGGGEMRVSKETANAVAKALSAVDRVVNNDSAVEERREASKAKADHKVSADKPAPRKRASPPQQPAVTH